MPLDGPNFPTVDQLIREENYQTDIPHVLSFAINFEDKRIVHDPACLLKDTLECGATQLYGYYTVEPKKVDKQESCALFEQNIKRFKDTAPPEFKDFLNSIAENQCPYDDIVIESLMLCPRPHFFNSGSHRVMMMLWYKGERYVLAVEEGQNLFAQGLTPGAKIRLKENEKYAVEILAASLKEVIDTPLFRTRYTITIYDDPQNLLQEGCTPSPYMNDL